MSASRTYRRGLAALVVLAPFALWTASGDDFLEYRTKHTVVETVAAVGATQDYGGSEWRIDRYDTWAGQPPDAGKALTATALPSGTRLVRVRVALRAKDEAAVKALDRCTLELVDGRGRRWNPGAGVTTARRDVPTRCNGTYDNAPQVAQAFLFEQDFLVPEDAAGDVDAVIRLAAEKPARLRLRLR